MSTKSSIIKSVNNHVNKNSILYVEYSNWYVGVTSDQKKRHGSHGKPNCWRHWLTDHHTHTRDLEVHFLNKGMKGDTGGGTYPRYIYVYKHSGPGAW